MLESILGVLCVLCIPPVILGTGLLWYKVTEARTASSLRTQDGRLDGLPPSAFIDHGMHGREY